MVPQAAAPLPNPVATGSPGPIPLVTYQQAKARARARHPAGRWQPDRAALAARLAAVLLAGRGQLPEAASRGLPHQVVTGPDPAGASPGTPTERRWAGRVPGGPEGADTSGFGR